MGAISYNSFTKICSGWRRLLLLLPLMFVVPHLFPGKIVRVKQDMISVVVKQLDQDPPAKDVSRKPPSKFDHLVVGPAAGQGLRNRLQCDGTKALSKINTSSSHVDSNEGSIAFVTVFTVNNSSTDGSRVTVENASYSKMERSMAILNVFINFIQETMPRSNVIILTDPLSDLSVNKIGVSIYPIQGEYSREKLMHQRIRSYIVFLERKLTDYSENHVQHYIFTDSDIAVVDDLGQIFRDYTHFHLAVTFRNNKQQPLNSGFIAVRGTREGLTRAKALLQEVLEVYSSKFMKASRMLGDQLALAWVISSQTSFDARSFTKAEVFLHEISGASVLFLPCAMYNWTPPEGAGQFHGMPLDIKVVHFKGSRKRLMLEFWNFYHSSAQISDMLCLILSSGRRKYDFDMFDWCMK